MRPLFASLVVVSFLALIAYSDTGFVRNHVVGNEQNCSAQQLAGLPKALNFIALGSSRVRAGISADILNKDYSDTFDPAYNLGRSGINVARSYRMLSDVLSQGVRPKYMYFEVKLDDLDSNSRNASVNAAVGAARDVGILTFSDILDARHYLERSSSLDLLYTYSNAFFSKLRSGLVNILSGRVLTSQLTMPESAELVCWRKYYDTRSKRKLAVIEKQRKKYEAEFINLDEAVLPEFEFGVGWRVTRELYYLHKIRELAEQYDIKFIVSRQWRAYQPPLSETSIATIQEKIPEFVFPPQQLVRDTWPHFVDRTHMFVEARKIFTNWVAEELLKDQVKP